MARRDGRRWLGIAGAVLVASGWAAAAEPVAVRGRVVDAEGTGLPAMLLVLSSTDRIVSRHATGADGAFEFVVSEFPVTIVPHRGRPFGWEFEPVASRVSGPHYDLEFTGHHDEPALLRGRLIDAVTGEPLAGAQVTVRRSCPDDAIDPAAFYRQPSVASVRLDDDGRFGVRCSADCEATILFRGDARHGNAVLDVEAGDCFDVHGVLVEPR
jgi:hypothetical protein